MSKRIKLIERLKSKPKDFTFDEMERVLAYFGYSHQKSGKTSGSRVKFVNDKNDLILLHKPHPSNIVKNYVIDQVIDQLGL